MRIRVINPNTTASMTDTIEAAAVSVAAPTTVVDAVTSADGPASIESHYEEALAVPGLLDQIIAGERVGTDGYLIACFGDPGLDAAREIASGPVIGIAEAGFHAAAMLGRRFGVVTTLSRTVGRAQELTARYGFASVCTEIRACDVPVLELDDPASDARRIVTEECRSVIARGADAVVLGCAGMADFCAAISAEIGAPVVDGVAAGTLLVESLIRLGLDTGRNGEYAAPPPKRFTGSMARFSTADAGTAHSASGTIENPSDTSPKHDRGIVLA